MENVKPYPIPITVGKKPSNQSQREGKGTDENYYSL